MKLLVTGSRGQVGSALCRLAAGYPFEVVGMDSTSLDITDPAMVSSVLATLRPDLLVNAAAYTAVDRAESEADRAMQVNAAGVGHLARATAQQNIPLVHLSTDYVFDGRKCGAYVEDDATAPAGVYGLSKLQGEQQLRDCQGRFIILRTSWVFGLEGHNFPKTMLRLAASRPEIGVVADQRGCPTFADDIARAVYALAGRLGAGENLPWGTYHYSGAEVLSWHDFALATFAEALGQGLISHMPRVKAITTAEYPTPARRPANSELDCRKFTTTFPAIPLSDWRDGVRKLVRAEAGRKPA